MLLILRFDLNEQLKLCAYNDQFHFLWNTNNMLVTAGNESSLSLVRGCILGKIRGKVSARSTSITTTRRRSSLHNGNVVPEEFIYFLCSLWLVNSSGEVLSWLFSDHLSLVHWNSLHSCALTNNRAQKQSSLENKAQSLSQLSLELAAFRTTKRITTVKITGFGLSVLHRRMAWPSLLPWHEHRECHKTSTAASYQDFGVLTVSHWTTI